MRIAVLLTNNDTSAFAANFPNDGEKVVQLLQPLRPQWSMDVLTVMEGVLPSGPEVFDGYVITGSPASVNDAGLPWVSQLLDFIRAVDRVHQPLIGLCFGHQAVARALGGQVTHHAGLGIGDRCDALAKNSFVDAACPTCDHFDGSPQRTGHPHARGR